MYFYLHFFFSKKKKNPTAINTAAPAASSSKSEMTRSSDKIARDAPDEKLKTTVSELTRPVKRTNVDQNRRGSHGLPLAHATPRREVSFFFLFFFERQKLCTVYAGTAIGWNQKNAL